MPDLLLLSNSTSPGMGFLEHARGVISELIGPGGRMLFVPFAGFDHDRYTQVMTDALAPLSIQVTGAHEVSDPVTALDGCDAVFVGGGNSFRLLRALEDTGLKAAIPGRVRAGLPYLGASAGTNMACPTLRTTNDMPIVQPASFDALGLIPFQVNPHYLDADPASTHQGETRAQRIAEFLQCNAVPVLGLREGSWLAVRGRRASLGGGSPARLFTRDAPGGTEMAPGTDVSELLSTVPRYDTR
ncbi:MAG TPA: dipeptidase PepE [Streptosporangiaceae bacterium]|nr:dipeptidase PepE [Streptosporangiaceae bacterium]